MELEQGIDLIFERNSILFTGAGATVTALNIKGNPIKSAKPLTDYLFEKCDIPSNDSLTDAVDEYIDKFGAFSLIDLLKEEYTSQQIQPEHEKLTSVNWKRIYTSNYDDVLEEGYKKNRKVLTPVTLSDRLPNYKDKSGLCIHLNGFVGRLNIETLNHEFKLSDTAYLTTDFAQSEWVNLFRNDLIVSDAIFFVGFSLNYDLDLKRIIFQDNTELKKKCFFILREGESEATVNRVRKFGQPCLIGLSKFAELLETRKNSYIPKEKIIRDFNCFSITNLHDNPPKVEDSDFFNFLIEGNVKSQILQYSIFSPENYPYYIEREKIKTVIDSIENKEKNVLVLSDLGNGKSVFIEGLSYRLKQKGYEVFKFNKYYDTLSKEIEEICQKKSKAVLVIDNYSRHFDILEKVKLLRTDLTLILSERNLVNDVNFAKLENLIGDSYLTIDINQLNDNDINRFVSLIDNYGYWKELASYGEFRKEQFLINDCRRNIRLFLLKLINSPNILNKFRGIIDEIGKTKNHFEALILILVSKVFGFRLDLDDLVYIFDEVLNNPVFVRDVNIREFVDFSYRQITVNSSILAESILQNLEESSIVIDTLIKVCRRLDSRREDRNIRNILKEIVSFSNLQRILKKEDKGNIHKALYFFEEIKNLHFCNRNSHFWLQYAIARLAERNYELADTYFKTAYSYADRLDNYDTYQIDTHYARHILENEIYNGSVESCMSQFLKAHKTLSNPSEKDKSRHYLFKVAQNYYPFYDRFYKSLKEQDKIIFLRSCDEMLSRIDQYIKITDRHKVRREVTKAKETLSLIIRNEKQTFDAIINKL